MSKRSHGDNDEDYCDGENNIVVDLLWEQFRNEAFKVDENIAVLETSME